KDRPPSVEVSSPSNDMTARPDDEIDIEFTASDDFGIAKSELVVYVDGPDDAELAVFDIPLGEQTGSTNVSRSVPLDLSQFHLKDGQSISYAIRVYDTRQSAASSGPNDDAPSPESETPSLADNADAAAPQTAVEGADRPGSPASSPSNEGTAPRASNREPGQPQAPTKANQAPKMLAESPPPSQPGTPDRASATAQTKPSDS